MSSLFSLPYDRGTLELRAPPEKLLGCFEPAPAKAIEDVDGALRAALNNPVESPPLRQLAQGRRSAVVVIDDSTRAVPDAVLLDAVLSELREGGLEPDRITVLAATGLHRPLTDVEFQRALGGWYGRVGAENHDARNPDRLAPLGTTSLGTPISVNRTFAEAELKVLTGDVEHHQFCGYGGGAKSVYPGLADREAIRTNHSRMDLPGTGPGRLDGNPVRREIDEAGTMAGIDFLLTVVLNADHEICAIHAGHWFLAFRLACPDVDRIYQVELPEKADLVVASAGGYPKDGTLYQAQKALRTAVGVVRPGGTVILAAACREGSGSALFEEWMEQAYEPADVIERIRESFVMGGHKAYQVAREVTQARVCLYSMLPPGKVRSWFMQPLRDIGEVAALMDEATTVSVLPQASQTLAVVAGGEEQ